MKIKIIMDDQYADVVLDEEIIDLLCSNAPEGCELFRKAEAIAQEVTPYFLSMLRLRKQKNET